MSDTALIALGVNFVLWVLTLILTAHYSCLGNISRRQGVTQVNSQALPSVAVVIVAQEEAGELRRHLPVFPFFLYKETSRSTRNDLPQEAACVETSRF